MMTMMKDLCRLLFRRKRLWPKLLFPQKEQKLSNQLLHKESIISSTIPRCIKTRDTKANPKIGEKEWTIPFTGNKENSASSSIDSEFTNATSISHLPNRPFDTPKPRPPPSPIHFEKFRRSVQLKETLTNA